MQKFLAGCFCLALAACAPSTQFLIKTYPPAQLESKSILLYPVAADQIKIANPGDFADDFEDVKSEPGEFLSKEINDNAAKNFETGFKFVQVANGADSNLAPLVPENSDKVTQKIGKEGFEIRVPKAEYLQSKGLNPKFVLVLDQIIYSRHLETYQQSVAPVPATLNVDGQTVKTGAVPLTVTTNQKSLTMGMNYLIYDYEDKTVVGYGFARGEKAFTFAMTRSDWYAAMDNTFGAIRKFTPFK
jgi:hypothetical protein